MRTGTTGPLHKITGTELEGKYERLAKAIARYNSGTWLKSYSWPHLLRTKVYDKDSSSNSEANGICHTCKYSLNIRKNAFGANSLRQYIWKGGAYDANLTDAEGKSDPKAGKEWCFGYGEEEWLDGKTFEDVKDAALDRNPDTNEIQTPQGRIDCITGVSL